MNRFVFAFAFDVLKNSYGSETNDSEVYDYDYVLILNLTW